MVSLRHIQWCVVLVWGLLANQVFFADSLEQPQQELLQNNQVNVQSQERINRLDDETRQLLKEYRSLLKENQQLQAYNQQLTMLVQDQNQEITRYQEEIATVGEFEQGVFPLLNRMLEGLAQFVKRDIPFLQELRLARIEKVKAMMRSSNVNVSEKFLRVMEAYNEEIDYGHDIEAYRAEVVIDGSEKTVDFVRIGRSILVYQTLDGAVRAVWDQKQQRWQSLGEEYRNWIKQAMLVARKQSAPDLLILPVPAAQAVGRVP